MTNDLHPVAVENAAKIVYDRIFPRPAWRDAEPNVRDHYRDLVTTVVLAYRRQEAKLPT